MAQKIKLISWNVNGIRAVMKKGFIDFLQAEEPDIIGLQEIKINDKARAKEEFDFSGYYEYWNPAQRPGYSGTAVFSKIKPLSVNYGIGSEKFDNEGRAITLEFEKFYLVNCYFPNANHELSRLDFKQEFNAVWLKYVKKLEKKKPVVTCGDFNVAREEIDLARPKENIGNPGFTKEERLWADKFLTNGLLDSFREINGDKIQYSWWSYRMMARAKNIGWRIDYFLVSNILKNKLKDAFILDTVLGSDHAPIGVILEI